MTIGQSTQIGQFATRHLQDHTQKMGISMQRLSSGKKLVTAKDNPAGLAVAEKMRMQLRMLEKQQDNTMDAISKTELQDGLMQGMQDIVQRMSELATQASNGSYSDRDRELLDLEYQQLLEELNNVGTQMNESRPVNMFSPTKPITAADIPTGSEATFVGGNLDALLDGIDNLLNQINLAAQKGDTIKLKELGMEPVAGVSQKDQLQQAIANSTKKNAEQLLSTPRKGSSSVEYAVTVGNGKLEVGVVPPSTRRLGLDGTNLKTKQGAQEAMDAAKNAGKELSKQRSEIGATYNRLERTMSRLAMLEENVTASLSRIEDVDMAQEMIEYTKRQILTQTSMYAVAHSKQSAQDTLALLRQPAS